jgi:hypothetical protein
MSKRSIELAALVVCLTLTGMVTFSERASAHSAAPMMELNSVSCLDPTTCMAAGTYTSAAGVDRPIVERWTEGSGWKLMRLPSLPSGAVSITLTSLSCFGRDFCMALGTYLESGAAYGATVPYSLVWRGSRWSLVSIPQPSGSVGAQISGVSCSGPRFCLAVGYYLPSATSTAGLVEQWNGSAWADFQAGGMDAVSCLSASGCTAVGRVESSGNESVLVEHWSGSAWTPGATLASGDVQDDSYATLSISCVGSRCMVAGEVSDDLGDTFTVAWDEIGGTWSSVPTPNLGGGYGSEDRYFFDGVSCTALGACTAVGGLATGNEVNLGERWDGTAWKVQSTPDLPGIYDTFLAGVSCADGRSCLAIGTYNDPKRNEAIESFAELWTNNRWTMTAPLATPPV